MTLERCLNYLAYSHEPPPTISHRRWAGMVKHIVTLSKCGDVHPDYVQSLFDMKGQSNVPVQSMQGREG